MAIKRKRNYYWVTVNKFSTPLLQQHRCYYKPWSGWKIAENFGTPKGEYSKCSLIKNINLSNDNTILSKEVNNVPLNKSTENLSDNFNLKSSK